MTVGKDTAMGMGIDAATFGLGKLFKLARGGALAAKLAKWANARKMARIRAIGAAGEKAVGITGKKKAIESITKSAAPRIPDALDDANKSLKEVKNVKTVKWTKQLEDFLLWSKREGYTGGSPTRRRSRPLRS